MNQVTHDERTLTELDYTRVSRLLASIGVPGHPAKGRMQEMLDSSDVVPSPAVPATVATMCSRVLLQEEGDGTQFEITLCYPPDADASIGKVSVLSPAGAAVLGMRAGTVARWRAPNGEERAARLLSVLFQPEASGDFLR